jgi:hypothetical protein
MEARALEIEMCWLERMSVSRSHVGYYLGWDEDVFLEDSVVVF